MMHNPSPQVREANIKAYGSRDEPPPLATLCLPGNLACISKDVLVVAPRGLGDVHNRPRQELGDEVGSHAQTARPREALQRRHAALDMGSVRIR